MHSGTTLDIATLFATHESERFDLHTRRLNEQMVRVLRTIGYDVGFCKGQGQYLYDRKGERYLDLLSGYGVFAVGRNHPAIRAGADSRMIAPDREHTIAAQQIKIPLTLAIVEVLSLSLAKADVIPDGPEHPHHLLVEPTGVEIEALGFVGGEQGRDIECGT